MDLIILQHAIDYFFAARPSFTFVSVESCSNRITGCPYLYVWARCRSRSCMFYFNWRDCDIFNGYLEVVRII